ncbi:isochorismate synthase [Kushneria aurantia]|uniref:isochorismate synthase n=1 Tax=Kushneria aurantia TaxID=504092 RepID=A0ABV6G7A8_9GAMM|nr:isochorismate synthase [Kushneria aurantia]
MNQPSSFDRPGALFERFASGDALFSSPTVTLLGRGVAHQCHTPDARPQTLENAARRLFDSARASGQAPLLMGMIPFDPHHGGRLFIPDELTRTPPCASDEAIDSAPLKVQATAMTAEPGLTHYRDAVARALALFDHTPLQKVVLARALRVDTAEAVETPALLRRLRAINPHGYNFALPLGDNAAPDTSLVGASPELLVRREGRRIIANPLAGSVARHDDADEDRRRAGRLGASDKDRREHALVVDAIVTALRPLCRELQVPAGPEVIATDRLWHLSTRLEGELADPDMSSLALAAALHPTPAVCGAPWREALDAIRRLEGFSRDGFAGLVGWCDENGDGEWAIAIRCAEVAPRHLRLFAGAGVLPGSTPEGELAETTAKMRTMLDALGLKEPPEERAPGATSATEDEPLP